MNSKYHKITATVPTEFHFGTATVKTALKTLVQNFHAFTWILARLNKAQTDGMDLFSRQ